MKLGTMLSRCIADIVKGIVIPEEVLLIIDYGNTNFDDPEEFDKIFHIYNEPHIYGPGPWHGLCKGEVFQEIDQLRYEGKIYANARFQNGENTFWTPWLELVVPNENLDEIPELKQAWEDYLVLAKLLSPNDK